MLGCVLSRLALATNARSVRAPGGRLTAHSSHAGYDTVGYKFAMGAAQSAPIPSPSPNVSAASDSVCEVNPLNPKGLKPYAIRSIYSLYILLWFLTLRFDV